MSLCKTIPYLLLLALSPAVIGCGEDNLDDSDLSDQLIEDDPPLKETGQDELSRELEDLNYCDSSAQCGIIGYMCQSYLVNMGDERFHSLRQEAAAANLGPIACPAYCASFSPACQSGQCIASQGMMDMDDQCLFPAHR